MRGRGKVRARLPLKEKEYRVPMPNGKKQKRAAPISYRPPAGLQEEFLARVEKSGLSTCAFITKAIFNEEPPRQSRRPDLEEKLVARLLNEAAKIHGELKALDTVDDAKLDTALDTLVEIRAALLKAMGRNP
jgi:hypothetical protein